MRDLPEFAADLSGRDIGLDFAAVENRGNTNAILHVGEIRQVYHVGGHVTISYVPAFGRHSDGGGDLEEITLLTSEPNDRIDVYDTDELAEVQVGDLRAKLA